MKHMCLQLFSSRCFLDEACILQVEGFYSNWRFSGYERSRFYIQRFYRTLPYVIVRFMGRSNFCVNCPFLSEQQERLSPWQQRQKI